MLLHWEPSEADPRLHAPPRSKPLRFGAQVPSEAQIRLGLRFVPFPGLSSSGVWRVRSLRLIAFPIPAAQADGDRPEPQEVLVSKEACLQFGS